MKRYIRMILFWLPLLVALLSCAKDESSLPGPGGSTQGDVQVMISMNIPSITETRALTPAQEYAIHTLDVLVFRDNGAGNEETYLYTTHGTDIPPTGSTSISSVKVGFRKSHSGEAHRFVFVANMRQEVEALTTSWDESMTRQEVLETLTFAAYDLAETDPRARAWDTTTPRYLPLWGESQNTHVVTSSLQGYMIGTIAMLRSVATVDIVLNPDPATYQPQGFGSRFTLKEIKVYNVPQQGYAAPAPAHLETSTKVDTPTFSSTFHRSAATVVGYQTDPASDEPAWGITRRIYLPEAPNTTSEGVNLSGEEQTCLVISGCYNGASEATWYRLDFIRELETNEDLRWDILRNHRYTFYITSVDGPGYPDEETAFRSTPVNLNSDVIVWNEEGKMNDITFDGQYSLRVSTDSLYFYDEGRAQALTLSTDHPSGWQLEIDPVEMNWVHADILSGAPDVPASVQISCDPIPSVQSYREGYIVVKAGKLRKYIKICQTNEPELTITVEPDRLVFQKGAPHPKTVTVTVYPEDALVQIAETPGPFPILWRASGGFPASGVTSSGTYSFQPQAMPDGSVSILSSFVSFYIANAQGQPVRQEITIMQIVTDILFNATTPTIPYGGGTGQASGVYFTANSDAPWRVSSTASDPDGLVGSFDNTNKPAGTGVLYEFTANPNPYFREREAIFNIESDDLEFTPRTVTVKQAFRSPYITFSASPVDLGNTESGNTGLTTVYSNAQWSYTTSSNWDQVFTQVLPATTTGGSSSACDEMPTDLSFNPVEYMGGAGTPAAGTLTATLAFETTNHSPADRATANLSVTRTVPPFFEYTGLSKTTGIARVGEQIQVYANTNAEWYATPASGSSGGKTGAGVWGNKSAVVNIGTHTGWGTRNVAITATYNGSVTVSAGSVTQNGYTFGYSGINRTDIPAEGCTYTLTFTGDKPAFNVELVIAGTVHQRVSCTGTSATVTLPANSTSAGRAVVVRYIHPQTGGTVNVVNGTQAVGPYDLGSFYLERTFRSAANWSTANSVCTGIGWRLPTKSELETIITKGPQNYGYSAIAEAQISGTMMRYLTNYQGWSNTIEYSTSYYSIGYIPFSSTSSAGSFGTTSQIASSTQSYRCVRTK